MGPEAADVHQRRGSRQDSARYLLGTSGEPQPQSVPHLECTYLYCETPKEPKCLKYIGETEKN